MQVFHGIGISDGIVNGKVIYQNMINQNKTNLNASIVNVEDVETEKKKYEIAREKVVQQLRRLKKNSQQKEYEDIFSAYEMLLMDEGFQRSVNDFIQIQKMNAESAVLKTGKYYENLFSEMQDAYFQARADDVKDIVFRLISVLKDSKEEEAETIIIQKREPFILASEELLPAQLLQLTETGLSGFVTCIGSALSHTAILARTMGIPAVYGMEVSKEWDGREVLLDGYTGTVYLEPEEEMLLLYENKKTEQKEEKKRLQLLQGQVSMTKSGQRIHLLANITGEKDLEAVLKNDAEGIGLFRTEFLYLEGESMPTEEEQFLLYKKTLTAMKGKTVTIRIFDLGADKWKEGMDLEGKKVDADASRGISYALSHPALLRTQLRALYRAGVFGELRILYPMITSMEEMRKVKEFAGKIKEELKEEQIPFGDVQEGIMIEHPAAVEISNELALEADFFSIGTNDLIQYTFGLDRRCQKNDFIWKEHGKEILNLIEKTVVNAHKAGISVGICGELGADTHFTEQFITLGIEELSMHPDKILQMREIVRELP